MRTTLLWLALALGACSSNDDTTREARDFVDEQGRSCRATLEKTTAGAPVLSQTIACEGEGRDCSSESQACFQLDVDLETFEIRNCPACCRGTATSFYREDCSALTCDTDAGCVYARATCSSGVCLCPSGSCD